MEFLRDRYQIKLVDGKPVLVLKTQGEVAPATDRLTQDEGLISVRYGEIAKIKDGVVFMRGNDGKIINPVHIQANVGVSADNYVDVIYLAEE